MFYPSSSVLSQLSQRQLQLKIARHSVCTKCNPPCYGLRPPSHVQLTLDEHYFLGDPGRDAHYLDSCACGHSCIEHGADIDRLGREEFTRKARVAIRLDEFLQDKGKLLDFNYKNEELVSLKRQMYPYGSSPLSDNFSPGSAKNTHSPDSSLSDPPHHPSKRQRTRSGSVSSLSEQEEDEDDEDRPLATRVPNYQPAAMSSKIPLSPTRARGRGGKKGPSHGVMKVPIEQPHASMDGLHLNGSARVVNGGVELETRVKLEDRVDEGQLSRLATGVAVDGGTMVPATSAANGRPEKAVYTEMRTGVIKVVAVENDRQPRSLIILTGLKTLFQKQLPKMPREYIARLVYDTNSKAMAIIKYGYKVVGGICYRPFPQRGFAEIVFFATASVDQVKGYGGMLMNYFKAHIRKTYPTMLHFLTYADNYAVGYFRKQGFSKDITLDRSVWAGYIKDYEGGTIMQCKMLPKVDYLKAGELVGQQKDAILRKIREMSRSHVVHEGIPQDVWERLSASRETRSGEGQEPSLDPKDIPGLRETGWSPSMQEDAAQQLSRSPQYSAMRRILGELQAHPLAWAFLQPVNGEEVADYYTVIKNPMDFSTMEHKLETSQYANIEAFISDANLVFRNCRTYNPETTVYAKNAAKLEKFLKELCEKMDIEC